MMMIVVVVILMIYVVGKKKKNEGDDDGIEMDDESLYVEMERGKRGVQVLLHCHTVFLQSQEPLSSLSCDSSQ